MMTNLPGFNLSRCPLSLGSWGTATVVLLAWFVIDPGLSSAADWPGWLGANGTAVWQEDGILEKFPAEGPRIKWRLKVGPGYTGPAVVRGRVFMMDRQVEGDAKATETPGISRIEGKERVFCLDAETGKLLWEHVYNCPYMISYPTGPRVTPLVDDDVVYTLGAMGDLFCFEASSGKILWQLDLKKEFNTKPPVWGYAAHPLLDGTKLVLPVGGEGSAVVALDKKTGKEVWRSLTVEEIGYAPLVGLEKDGRRQLIFWHDMAVHGLDPESGKNLWTEPFPVDGEIQRPAVTIATPRVSRDRVFISDFYHGGLMLKVATDPPSAEPMWSADAEDPEHEQGLNILMATPTFSDGKLYGVSGNGEMRCLDAETGKVLWRDVRATGDEPAYFATCFAVRHQDRYFLFNDQGFLIIAKMTPAGYEELDRARLLEPVTTARGRNIVWSHPAFAHRCVFARNDAEIVCADLGRQG